MSGPELARRLEVEVRTVRRYITMLEDLGIPIQATRGRYGAYSLRPGFKLPPLMFSEDEALALTMGLLAARRLGLAVDAPSVEGALAKVDRVLPEALQQRVRAIQESLVLNVPTYKPPPNAPVGTFGAAVKQRRRVRMRYRSFGGVETERDVDPYGMVYHVGLWYTAGHCHLRGGLRMFRLDRVVDVEMGQARFDRPAGFDPLEYVLRSLATMPGTYAVEVLLLASLEEAQRQVPPSLATLEPCREGVLMRCSANCLDWIARVLNGLNFRAVVREPPELTEPLRRLAGNILSMAEPTPYAGDPASV